MAPLLRLPFEITKLVFDELSLEDFLHLRQTCKEANAKIFHLVSQNFFQAPNVMLERQSLECLLNISKHHHLAGSITTLNICIDHLLPLEEVEEMLLPHGQHNSEERRTDRLHHLNVEEYRKLFNDQERLMQTGRDIEYLTETMNGLVNCKEINIGDGDRPWGLDRLRKCIGVFPRKGLTPQSRKSIEVVSHVLQAVLVAVANSQLLIEDLDINIGDPMNYTMSKETANYTSPRGRIVPSMLIGPSSVVLKQRIIGGLRQLSILLDPGVSGEESSSWESDLAYFFGLVPQLSGLQLRFRGRDDHGRFSALCSALYFPKLEVLTLESVCCTGMDLVLFLLRHHKTLREISFSSVDLSDGIKAWCRLVEVIRDILHVSSFSMLDSLDAGRDLECVSGEIHIPDHLEATSARSIDRIACLLHRAAWPSQPFVNSRFTMDS
ncbi:hypothetical protein FDECE_11707 [Fusarium decemcellulare]|nr:hypothetical protein FDECE_11707 [Fusarium decemcellulare]